MILRTVFEAPHPTPDVVTFNSNTRTFIYNGNSYTFQAMQEREPIYVDGRMIFGRTIFNDAATDIIITIHLRCADLTDYNACDGEVITLKKTYPTQ
jgi:hypothetical protein